MKKLLIIETYYEGHYLTGYIKYILRSLKKQKYEITLLTSKNTLKYGKGAIQILNEEKVKFKIISTDFDNYSGFFQGNLYFQQIINYNKIINYYKKNLNNTYDLICFTSLQRFLIPLCLFGNPFNNIPIIGIFLGAKFHLKYFNISQTGRFDIIYKLLFKILLKKPFIKKVILNDHLLEKHIKRFNRDLSKKILFLHDPKETRFKLKKVKVKKSLNLEQKSKYILLYGALIESKGLEELSQIIKSNYINKNIRLIIAGKQFLSTKSFLKSAEIKKLIYEKKIIIFNGWQKELMEAKLFTATDIIWIAYKNYSYPSGVLYQAASFGLPVIVSNDGLINQLNKKYKFGISIDIFNIKSSVKEINNLMNKKRYNKLSKNIKIFYNLTKPINWVKSFSKVIKNL